MDVKREANYRGLQDQRVQQERGARQMQGPAASVFGKGLKRAADAQGDERQDPGQRRAQMNPPRAIEGRVGGWLHAAAADGMMMPCSIAEEKDGRRIAEDHAQCVSGRDGSVPRRRGVWSQLGGCEHEWKKVRRSR